MNIFQQQGIEACLSLCRQGRPYYSNLALDLHLAISLYTFSKGRNQNVASSDFLQKDNKINLN